MFSSKIIYFHYFNQRIKKCNSSVSSGFASAKYAEVFQSSFQQSRVNWKNLKNFKVTQTHEAVHNFAFHLKKFLITFNCFLPRSTTTLRIPRGG